MADAVKTANLTSIGGPADQKVVDSIVQEIDISTGKVLFQWNAADHVPYQDSGQHRNCRMICHAYVVGSHVRSSACM